MNSAVALESPSAIDPEGHVELRPDLNRAVEAKWGTALTGGFQIIPDLLLRYQSTLSLTANDVVVLLHLTMAWWEAERPPFPRPITIARRMGASERTVQRSLSRLLKKKIFKKIKVRDSNNEWRQAFDLTPLAAKLNEIAETDMIVMRRRLHRNEAAGVQNQSLAQAQ